MNDFGRNTENLLIAFIQKREFTIMMHNDCNLTSYNGLETVHMILKHADSDFDFKPLLSKTENYLFADKKISDYVLQEIVSRFDEVEIVLAGLFAVLQQHNFQDFMSDLNLILDHSGISLDR